MSQPKATRPDFPAGYLTDPQGLLEWGVVEAKLEQAKNYWLCTVRPDGRPHAVPKWGVWVDGRLYFDGSPETRHSRNIAVNPHVVIHLESGDEVVSLEGEAEAVTAPPRPLTEKVARAYRAKYAALGYSPQPEQWDEGGLYRVTPKKVLAWTRFTDDPTKFSF